MVKTFNKEVSTEVYFRHLAFSTNGEKHGMMDVNEKVLLPEQYDIIDTDGNGNLLTQNENPDDWGYICGLYTQDCKHSGTITLLSRSTTLYLEPSYSSTKW